MAAAPNTNWENARERKGFYPRNGSGATPGLGRGRLQPAVTRRYFWLFGEVVCVENWTVSWYCSRCAMGRLLKGRLKHAGLGPCERLPCQQRTRLKAQFAPTEYNWAEVSESYTVRGFLGLIPVWLAGWGLCRV